MSSRGLENIKVLFAQEAEQRLTRLGQLVLQLEQPEVDDLTEVVVEIFREVHTLKGAAAVVGFEDVGHYAHGVEEKLGLLRTGEAAITPRIIDALLVAI
ncbi:MAG TPA: Hpt domain-containing protein, partial [Ilumatobacteraceae bacterium]